MKTCKCCGKPLAIFTQPSIVPGKPARDYGTCWTPGCDRYAITLELDTLSKLTTQEVAAYKIGATA